MGILDKDWKEMFLASERCLSLAFISPRSFSSASSEDWTLEG